MTYEITEWYERPSFSHLSREPRTELVLALAPVFSRPGDEVLVSRVYPTYFAPVEPFVGQRGNVHHTKSRRGRPVVLFRAISEDECPSTITI